MVERRSARGLVQTWRNAVVMSPRPSTGIGVSVGGWDGAVADRL